MHIPIATRWLLFLGAFLVTTNVGCWWPSMPWTKKIPHTVLSLYLAKNGNKIKTGIAIGVASAVALYNAYHYFIKPLYSKNAYILDSIVYQAAYKVYDITSPKKIDIALVNQLRFSAYSIDEVNQAQQVRYLLATAIDNFNEQSDRSQVERLQALNILLAAINACKILLHLPLTGLESQPSLIDRLWITMKKDPFPIIWSACLVGMVGLIYNEHLKGLPTVIPDNGNPFI